jgi:hypothetical protein
LKLPTIRLTGPSKTLSTSSMLRDTPACKSSTNYVYDFGGKNLDALTDDLNEKLVERASSDSELVPSYVDLARALERIGDHATNIAEDSFWRDQAADIRHTYSPKKES